MGVLGMFVLTVLCVYRVQAGIKCFACDHILDPENCKNHTRCHRDESCSTLVYNISNTSYFDMGCRNIQECYNYPSHHFTLPTNFPPNLICSKCCNDLSCHKHACRSYMSPITQTVPTATEAQTPASSSHATAKASLLATHLPSVTGIQLTTTLAPTPNCRDHEEDGIGCAMLDLYNLCTDKSVLGYVTAHKKCSKHCGFCTPTTKLISSPASAPPRGICADYEQDGLRCASLKAYGICTDTSTFAFVLSHKKCRKYCGLCQSSSGSSSSANGLVTSTLPPPPSSSSIPSKIATMAFSATPIGGIAAKTKALSTTTTQASSTITKAPLPTTKTTVSTTPHVTPSTASSVTTATTHTHTTIHNSLFPCVDFEDSTFSCAVWTSHGYCNQVPGIGYETAKLRCRKFCGFC